MKILDYDIDFDFNDADDMERMENAIEKTQKKLNNIDVKDKKPSEIIRETCQAIFDCYNEIFGENTDKKIFGNKANFNLCVQSFKDLIKNKEEQEISFSESVKEIEKKYSPNRATRRAKK